jgi:hypothetical protein
LKARKLKEREDAIAAREAELSKLQASGAKEPGQRESGGWDERGARGGKGRKRSRGQRGRGATSGRGRPISDEEEDDEDDASCSEEDQPKRRKHDTRKGGTRKRGTQKNVSEASLRQAADELLKAKEALKEKDERLRDANNERVRDLKDSNKAEQENSMKLLLTQQKFALELAKILKGDKQKCSDANTAVDSGSQLWF